MKKIITILTFISLFNVAFGQPAADLNGVTFGFGAGYSHTFDKTYDYSLTTDVNHNLKLQPLNKGAFVISSVVMVKLGKVAFDQSNNTFVKQSNKIDYNHQKALLNQQIAINNKAHYLDTLKNLDTLKKKFNKFTVTSLLDHLSVNLSLDLVNIASDVSFNKNINGGLGLGYFITDNLQFALFYDVSRISQLRDYIVNDYQGKSIPNGSGTNYNSLSTSDNNLFYNKTVSGLSFKLIFSLANKKQDPVPANP
jgi:hypothetical protein